MRAAFLFPLLLAASCSKRADDTSEAGMSAAQVSSEARKIKLEPGEWETTTKVTKIEVQGLPKAAAEKASGTNTVTRNCITPAEAARPDANILSGTKEGNCTYQRFSMAGSKIDAAMTCSPRGLPGKMAMTLEGDYSPTAYVLDMAMKADLPGSMAMDMKASVSGRRIGECSAGTGEAAR